MSVGKEVVVWDVSGDPPCTEGHLLWRGHENCGEAVSLLKIVESESDSLRERYFTIRKQLLEVVGVAVESMSFGKEMQKQLLWMSLLVESNTMISPLLSVLRLLAVESLLKQNRISKICYKGKERAVAQALGLLADRYDAAFCWGDGKLARRRCFFPWAEEVRCYCRAWGSFLRAGIRAMWYATGNRDRWFSGENSVFFVSYFTNLDGCAARKKQYESLYWGTLPRKLVEWGKTLNWLQLPIVGTGPKPKEGAMWLRGFTERMFENGHHAFLDSFFSWEVLLKTMRRFLMQPFFYGIWAGKAEREIKQTEGGWLWPLFVSDFRRSFVGGVAVQHLLVWNLFDSAMRKIPKQKIGFYLCENLGWERAFLAGWRKYGHGTIIGVAHATVRYWDLRYFSEKGLDKIPVVCDLPKPDFLAVNGNAAVEVLRHAGYPMNKMVAVEALRYLYLGKARMMRDRGIGKKRMVVFGDILVGTTERLLRSVEEVAVELEERYEVSVKSHPANLVDLKNFPNLRAKLFEGNIQEVLSEAEVALASVYTSSGLDAACAGVRTAIFLDPEECNFSPLRSVAGTEFFSSGRELLQVIARLETSSDIAQSVEDYFWVDSELPRWKKVVDALTEAQRCEEENLKIRI